jgi:serine/threonine-protein kinase RsbW
VAHLTVHLRNDIGDLSKLTGLLAQCREHFGIPDPLLHQLELALDEIVTNVISYGYADDAPHVIRVDVGVHGEELTATVEDDGLPFNPLDRAAPDTTAPIEDRAIGGLGIHLVRELMDRVRYDRIGDRNRLTIAKSIGPAASGGR